MHEINNNAKGSTLFGERVQLAEAKIINLPGLSRFLNPWIWRTIDRQPNSTHYWNLDNRLRSNIAPLHWDWAKAHCVCLCRWASYSTVLKFFNLFQHSRNKVTGKNYSKFGGLMKDNKFTPTTERRLSFLNDEPQRCPLLFIEIVWASTSLTASGICNFSAIQPFRID